MDTAMELSFWKEEPLSPIFSGLEGDQTDVWKLFEDDLAKQALSPEKDPLDDQGSHGDWLPDSPGDSRDSLADFNLSSTLNARAQLAAQMLDKLDDVHIKEEVPFSDWYETKTDLPIFDELPASPAKEEAARPFASLSAPFFPPPAAPAAVLVPLSVVQLPPGGESLQPLLHPQHGVVLSIPEMPAPAHDHSPGLALPVYEDTQTLLQEFECVFGKVEQSHGALTPPQSPPHDTFRAPAPAAQLSHLPQLLPHEDFSGGLTPNPQLIAEVDEIVRSRVDAWSTCPPSPCTSSSSSDDATTASSPPPSPETDDPDWYPGSPTTPDSEERAAPRAAPSAAPGKAKKNSGRRAGKPYAANVEDKRQRKKEQNKNAATRYRMKKKAEVEVILGEESELKDKNTELQAKVQDLSQEIRYLKNLMRDVFRAKGLIK